MAEERPGAVTFMDNPFTLVGKELKAGDKAPGFTLMTDKLSEVTYDETFGPRVFTTFPSVDTPVCDEHLKSLAKAFAELPEVTVYAVSADLPFAQTRWATETGIGGITFLSDYREACFGANWGVLIKEARLLARAVFVVDSDDIVRHVEVVKEVTNQPDIQKAFEAAKQIQ